MKPIHQLNVLWGDFFACGWGKYCHISSLPVCVNPGSAFNCCWQMPFHKICKITLENLDDDQMTIYYQINYTLTLVPDDAAYFHAQFRRPLKTKGTYSPNCPAVTNWNCTDDREARVKNPAASHDCIKQEWRRFILPA